MTTMLTSGTPRRDMVVAMSQRWIEEHRSEKARERVRLQLVEAVAGIPIRPYPRPLEMIEQVAFWHGLDPWDIRSSSRKAHLMQARFDAIAAVYGNCRVAGRLLPLQHIANLFGGRHHTTILSALRQRGYCRP